MLFTRGRSGANFNPIQKKCWSSGGPSSLQMTIYKGTEEHGGGQIIQMVICNNPCLSVPLILVIWRTVLFASDHLQRYGGDWIIWMIICNNSCSFVPLLLVIQRTVLFANDHLQRKGRARRRPNHPDDHFQGSLIPEALIYDGTDSI